MAFTKEDFLARGDVIDDLLPEEVCGCGNPLDCDEGSMVDGERVCGACYWDKLGDLMEQYPPYNPAYNPIRR